MRSHDEMELTPKIEAVIRQEAMRLGLNPELLRFYFRFGADAPRLLKPSWRTRRWLRRLAKRSGL